VQSGGFGSFSKGFGSAAASLLEAEVVTADGTARVVNACQEPELFWALKGGGGGSWGVITRLTLATHELPAHFGAAWGKIKASSDAAYQRLIARFLEFYAADLMNPHWGEQVSVDPDNILKLSMVCQGLDAATAQHAWEPFFAFVRAAPDDFRIVEELGAGARAARGWWDLGGTRLIKDPRPEAPAHHAWWQGDQDQVGAYLYAYDSLWLPAALLREGERARLADALFAGSRHQEIELHFNKGLAGAPPEALRRAKDTATNPKVLEAFTLAIIADGEDAAYPGLQRAPLDQKAAHGKARAVAAATAELRRIAPHAGSYVSESDYFNAEWREEFWGGHYARLRTIKDKYDPDGLFFGHHGVGSEDFSADGFTRLG
jgi:FAD/FMN-containing dehydrogenase